MRAGLGLGLALTLTGCWWWLDPAPANGPTVSERLEKCRDEARAAFYADASTSAGEAEAIYERCVEREGVK